MCVIHNDVTLMKLILDWEPLHVSLAPPSDKVVTISEDRPTVG